MQLNLLNSQPPVGRGGIVSKTLLVMKITCFLLLVASLQIHATGFSQRLTINASNADLKTLFTDIKQQTGYQFFFNERLLNKGNKVSLDIKNAPLMEVLDSLFKNQPFTYVIVDKTITVKNKAKPETTAYHGELDLLRDPVTGTVTDANGQPLMGVSVSVKGSLKGSFTDANGRYSITPDDNDKVLIFSFVGMVTQEVTIGKLSQINITMQLSNAHQEEVVVIGYGTSKVKDMTASVSRITAADLEGAPPHADMAGMLQGKAAGVNVMISNGAPGSAVAIQIRGATSLTGNNQPLWVVDGIPQYNARGDDMTSLLYDFNISDVESIDILKDASATAIYGSRAANGVILVTTKKGSRLKKPQIDFTYNLGIQSQSDNFRMLNTEEYKAVYTDAARNNFYTLGTTQSTGGISLLLDFAKVVPGAEVDYLSAPIKSNAFFDGTADWWNELTQNAVESKYNVSVRGGSPVSNYYMAFGHASQEGIVKGSNRKGYTGRLNYDAMIGDYVKAGILLNGSYSTLNNKDDMIDKIWNFRPDFPMYDEDGKPFDPGYNEENPLTSLNNRNLTDRKSLNASAIIEIRPATNFVFKSTFSSSYNQSVLDRFVRMGSVYTTHKGQANMTQTESSNWVFENMGTYSKNFNKVHDITALAGFIVEKAVVKNFATGVQNFPDQDIMTNLSSGTTAMKPTSTFTSKAQASALTRLNYRFQDKYLATFSFRAEGSSRFGPDSRWGYFPSGAIAWMISNENFIRNNIPVLSSLKIRTSYGKSGSQALGNHDWRTLYTASQFDESPGFSPSQLGNYNLRWETTIAFDLGLDFGFFKDRLRGTIGRYTKDTRDIIYKRNIPASSSFTTVNQNVANIRNSGLEFDVNYDLITNKDMTLTLNFNIATNTSKALKINGVDSVIELYAGNAIAMRIKEGEPLNQWVGYKWSGRYYQSMEEYQLLAQENPVNGAKIWYQSGSSTIRPGDLRFEDTNGDEIINEKDRVALGTAQPKLFGGFSPSFRYKNFSINTNFSYSVGSYRYWYTNSANWYGLGLFLKNYPAYVLDSWSTTNRDALWPRMSFGQGSSNTFSDFWLSRADYLRLNNLRVSYRVPKKMLQVKMINSIDFSISASNLLTFTNYNGIDPQGNFRLSGGGVAGTGTDYGTYPAMKSYNLSARITFN